MEEIRKGGVGHNPVIAGVWVEGTPSEMRIIRMPRLHFQLHTEKPIADLRRWSAERGLQFIDSGVVGLLTRRLDIDVQIAGPDPRKIAEVIELADEKFPKLRPAWAEARLQAAALVD